MNKKDNNPEKEELIRAKKPARGIRNRRGFCPE